MRSFLLIMTRSEFLSTNTILYKCYQLIHAVAFHDLASDALTGAYSHNPGYSTQLHLIIIAAEVHQGRVGEGVEVLQVVRLFQVVVSQVVTCTSCK